MGCVHSGVENEETVIRCRDRKMLMKQLLTCRSDLATAHMAYLHSLRNTGATLRQFAESESEVSSYSPPCIALSLFPPSLPLPLPPSPPPPQFSKVKKVMKLEDTSICGVDDDDDETESCIPPPPPIRSIDWNLWDPFDSPSGSNLSSPMIPKKVEGKKNHAVGDEERWDETITEFEDENEDERKEKEFGANLSSFSSKEKSPSKKLADESTSMIGRLTKEIDEDVVAWSSKKSFVEIVKELDDYFLKAAASGSGLIGLLEWNYGQSLESDLKRAKGFALKSAKVLSWNWSFKSYSNKGACGPYCLETCRPGKHRRTLEKIYTEEEKLYREVKEDQLMKMQLEKMIYSLEKLKKIENNSAKFERPHLEVETLQAQILSLQESINSTCLSISNLRDEELHPQLLEFTLSFLHMWRAMHKFHQIQNHISRLLVGNHSINEPTTDSHHFAVIQLENEVASWHSSFCGLLKALRTYVQVLNQWIRLTDCLPYSSSCLNSIKGVNSFCEEWQLALDRLPDKMAADSIKSFISAIHSIVLQQRVELSLEKKSKRLENRLEKKLNACNSTQNTSHGSQPTSNNAELDALKKRVDDEKAKYLSSICDSRALASNNLYTWLPNVFHALAEFSNACSDAFNFVSISIQKAK